MREVIRRFGVLATAAVTLLGASVLLPPSPAAANTLTICKGQAIPTGYVAVSEGSSNSCPGSFPNTWTVQRPPSTGTTVICAISPITPGFVVIGTTTSGSCAGGFPNAKIIQRA